jgi:hypothetical protein
MLKYMWICAALLAHGSNPAQAQQQEAVVHRVEVPGTGFDVIVAIPKVRGVVYDLADSPDALLVHLDGGLALAFESVESMVQALDLLRRPVCAAQIVSKDGMSRMPMAVYLAATAE